MTCDLVCALQPDDQHEEQFHQLRDRGLQPHPADPQYPPTLSQHFRCILHLFNVPLLCVAVIKEHALGRGYDNLGSLPASLGAVHPDPRGY